MYRYIYGSVRKNLKILSQQQKFFYFFEKWYYYQPKSCLAPPSFLQLQLQLQEEVNNLHVWPHGLKKLLMQSNFFRSCEVFLER